MTEWRSIDTAPKDKVCLVGRKKTIKHSGWVDIARFDNLFNRWEPMGGRLVFQKPPTHYMPLPLPPEGE